MSKHVHTFFTKYKKKLLLISVKKIKKGTTVFLYITGSNFYGNISYVTVKEALRCNKIFWYHF